MISELSEPICTHCKNCTFMIGMDEMKHPYLSMDIFFMHFGCPNDFPCFYFQVRG